MPIMKTSIYTLSRNRLLSLVKEAGQPAFRGKQLYEWLYVHYVDSFDEMSNLPKALRQKLEADYSLIKPSVFHKAVSFDGTRKYVFQLEDGALIESVGIPSGKNNERLTVCFSTQVGCAMQCQFCATAKEGFTRNLSIGEIVGQILLVQEDFQQRVSNIVGMGQGEPFANYDNVLEAIRILNDPKGIAIGARHITISTCGLFPGIERFSQEPEQFTLAISLHAALQNKRDTLMPRVANMPLSGLKETLQHYTTVINRRVTLEYLLINGVNDSEEDLKALTCFCTDLLCHVNLLPLNNIDDSPWKPSGQSVANHWISTLMGKGIETSMRQSRGSDIDAACGQLKNSLRKK